MPTQKFKLQAVRLHPAKQPVATYLSATMLNALFPQDWPVHHPNAPIHTDPGLAAGLQLLRGVDPALMQDGHFRSFQQKVLFPHIWNVRSEAAQQNTLHHHQALLIAEQERLVEKVKADAVKAAAEESKKKAEEAKKKEEADAAAKKKKDDETEAAKKKEKEDMLKAVREEVAAEFGLHPDLTKFGLPGHHPWGAASPFGNFPPKKKGKAKKAGKNDAKKHAELLEKIAAALSLDEDDEDEDEDEDDIDWDAVERHWRRKQAQAAFEAELGLNGLLNAQR